jgi:hypothetical protein
MQVTLVGIKTPRKGIEEGKTYRTLRFNKRTGSMSFWSDAKELIRTNFYKCTVTGGVWESL